MTTTAVGALHLPALWGGQVEGWIAALGLLRVISTDWPNAGISWDANGYAIIHDGPTTEAEAASAALATVHAVPPGGVLPDVPADWPPAGRELEQRDCDWGLITDGGHLHPMIRLHAAQTLRGVIDAPRRVLAAHPDLMGDAITGTGLDARYGAGLWMFRHAEEPLSRASAGRDWLALCALPWMPAIHDIDGRPMAAGWVGPDQVQWRLWESCVPAGAVPAMLAAEFGYIPAGSASASLPRNYGPPGPVFAAVRKPRPATDKYRPPYFTSFAVPGSTE